MTRNRFNLMRTIPVEVARFVRQRDGFGCVVCGSAIYDYDHINPEFKDAKAHTPDGIILLCPTCHRKKGNFLSLEKIIAHARVPRAKQAGFSSEAFDIGEKAPAVKIGPVETTGCQSVIRVDGIDLFSVAPPEDAGGPFRLNAALYDSNENPIFQIVDNQWRVPTTNWDVEVVGKHITVRKSKGAVALCLRSEPSYGLIVESLDLTYAMVRVQAREAGDLVITRGESNEFRASRADLIGCEAAIDVAGPEVTIGLRCSSSALRFRYGSGDCGALS